LTHISHFLPNHLQVTLHCAVLNEGVTPITGPPPAGGRLSDFTDDTTVTDAEGSDDADDALGEDVNLPDDIQVGRAEARNGKQGGSGGGGGVSDETTARLAALTEENGALKAENARLLDDNKTLARELSRIRAGGASGASSAGRRSRRTGSSSLDEQGAGAGADPAGAGVRATASTGSSRSTGTGG
jgi:hypothetical protein